MTRGRTGERALLATAVTAASLLLAARTADRTPPHVEDGRADLDLSVTGQPSCGELPGSSRFRGAGR